jgi:phosphatidylglycerophosphate synthase
MKTNKRGRVVQADHGTASLINPRNTFFSAAEAHTRINDILLGPLERPALHWLATHMPAWITPDGLTGLGMAASILIFISYALTNVNHAFLWLASVGFILNWFGDSLDGTLARTRKIERPKYGFFVDHTIDAMSEVLVFLGIGFSPYVDFKIACLALVGYMLVSNLVYITTYVKGVFRISYIKIGPTEMRVLAVITNTVVFFIGNPMINLSFTVISLYSLVALGVSLLLFGGFVVMAIIQAGELAREEAPHKK